MDDDKTQPTGMESTMHDIDMQDNPNPKSKKELISEISSLEKDIKSAQDGVDEANDSRTSYTTTVSPEEANARKKTIVFKIKDLDKMKEDLESMNS